MSPELREEITENLNKILCTLIDLSFCVYHGHLNTKGPNFISLHLMYEDFYECLHTDIDLLAEVIVSLGGVAKVFPSQCAELTVCPSVDVENLEELNLVAQIADCHAAARDLIVEEVEELLEDSVQGVADTLLGIQQHLELHLYKLEAHLS